MVPRTVVPLHNLLPRGHSVTGDVGHPRFHSMAMLYLVTANDLNLHDRHSHPFSNGAPFVAREWPWIHAVGDNRVTNAQVVDGDAWATAYPSASTAQPACRSACSIESMRR
jgi:hypothetical protein